MLGRLPVSAPLLALVASLLLPAMAARAVCGDGVLDAGEACDDGGVLAGDCCAPDCTLEAEGGSCDDGVACTTDDACELGVCRGEPDDPFCGAGSGADDPLLAFACYRARPERAGRGDPPLPAFDPRAGELVRDEYGPDGRPLDLKKTLLLCSAAVVEGVGSPADLLDRTHLLSYAAKPARAAPRFLKREAGFDTGLATAGLKVKKPAALMVPTAIAAGTGGIAAGPAAGPPPRFQCYTAKLRNPRKATEATPRPFAKTTLSWLDAVSGTGSYRVGKPIRICLPEVGPVGMDDLPAPPIGYLVCHKARSDGPAPAALPAAYSTRNDFGDEVLRVERIAEICLPGRSWAAPPGSDPPFPFLREKGEVETALATLWRNASRAPQSASEAREAFEQDLAARAVIAANGPAAQKAILGAMKKLGPEASSGWASFLPLVAASEASSEVLARLHDVLMDPRTTTNGSHDIPAEEVVRQLVMGALVHQAQMGSAEAKGLVLESAGSPHPDVCAAAVRGYYGLERDRRIAQRALRERLDPSMEHVLWQE